MIDRTRMLLDDIDSEGFPIAQPCPPNAAWAYDTHRGIARAMDNAMPVALLADHACIKCNPSLVNMLDQIDSAVREGRTVRSQQ